MKFKRFIKAFVFATVSTLSFSCLASCSEDGTNQDKYQLSSSILLSAPTTTIFVDGSPVQITITNKEEGKDYVFISSDESIATVDADGLVQGLKEGVVTIDVYQSDNFNVKGNLTITVLSGNEINHRLNEVVVDTRNVTTTFRVSDEFTSDGLIVTINGARVYDYTTNPAEGTLLNQIGEMDVVVSVEGAISTTYSITVNGIEPDSNMVDFMTRFNNATNYSYQVELDMSLTYNNQAYNNIIFRSRYTEDAYYLDAILDGTVSTTTSSGYVNTEDGVMLYQNINGSISPVRYVSHTRTNYKDLSLITYQYIDPETMPTIEIDGYYSVTDTDLTTWLTSVTYTHLSNATNIVQDIKGYYYGDSVEFVADCGSNGTITMTFYDIDNTEVEDIHEYIEKNGTATPIYAQATRAQELFALNNFTYSLGTSVGELHATEKYVFYNLTETYVATSNQNSFGYAEHDGDIYYFEVSNNQLIENSLSKVYTLSSGETFVDVMGIYPSTLSMFNENMDMYVAQSLTLDGYTYIGYGIDNDNVPNETTVFLGYTPSTSLMPTSTGFIIADNGVDSTAAIMLYILYYNTYSSYTFYHAQVYYNFGVSNVDVIDQYLASLS